jgi:simple sugar transport system permease protein
MSLRRVRAVATIPLLAIVLALVLGAVIMIFSSPLILGLDPALPLVAYKALAEGAFGSFEGVVTTVVNASPLILAGLAVGVAFKAGLFNIGAQGQFLMGGLTAAAVGAWLSQAPGFVAIPAAILAAILVGSLYGALPGALKAYTGSHEVVTTIMLNYTAQYVVAYVVTGPLRAVGATFARTPDVGNASLPILVSNNGHLGTLFAFMAVPVAWWLLYRSTVGFEIRTVGAGPDAARYAGMRPRFLIVLTMAFCGGLAALAGSGEILGLSGFMPAGYSTNVGFDGITVALLGQAHPVGIMFAGLLLGAMRAGSGLMQIEAGVPAQMVDVLQGAILFFLTAELLVRYLFRIRARSAKVSELQTVARSYGGQTAP